MHCSLKLGKITETRFLNLKVVQVHQQCLLR